MFSVITLPLILIIICCVVVLGLHARMLARYNHVEACRNALEEAIQQYFDAAADLVMQRRALPGRMPDDKLTQTLADALSETGVSDKYASLNEMLSETYESEGYAAPTAESWRAFMKKAGTSVCDALHEAQTQVEEAGRVYDEALVPYHAALHEMPGRLLARIFLFHAEPSFHPSNATPEDTVE